MIDPGMIDPLSISVCIPCAYKHFYCLEECLNNINSQSLLPNEVSISISGVPQEKIGETNAYVETYRSQFKRLFIKCAITSELKFAGENRNIAMYLSESNIITFIDVDDLMTHNRIFTLRMIFAAYPDTIGVIHKYHENIFPVHHIDNFELSNIKTYIFSEDLHFGHATFKKQLFNKFIYSDKARGQDIEFVHNILPNYRHCLKIYDRPLSYYMSNRSLFFTNEEQ